MHLISFIQHMYHSELPMKIKILLFLSTFHVVGQFVVFSIVRLVKNTR